MPITAENVRAISAWEQAEGTKASFNPLATTQGGFAGETKFNSVGVKNYATYQDGIDANVHGITNGRYPNILDALRAGQQRDGGRAGDREFAVGHARRRAPRARVSGQVARAPTSAQHRLALGDRLAQDLRRPAAPRRCGRRPGR